MKKVVYIKSTPIGCGNKIAIQSMTNTLTTDIEATVKQVISLYNAGADIVRVSLPTIECIKTVKELALLNIPIVGDIHFDYKIALAAVENGIDKIRINPSNLPQKGIVDIVKACKLRNIPIRVGVNKGSVKEENVNAKRLAQLTLESARMIEDLGYDNLVLATKASDVKTTIEANGILNELSNYPLHIGLTEAGTKESGIIKSAVAIGSLLTDNIGDTIRVSLASNPIDEVKVATQILRASGKDKNFVEVIACPTCARTTIDIQQIATSIENATKDILKPIKIAVMGCFVNGIGEAKDADFGVAGGKNDTSVIFENGEILRTVENKDILNELLQMVEKYNG